VSTATDVLLSRGIECFWILADTNVIAAALTVVDHCRKAGVPVITNFPAMAKLGAAISFGADYHAMGVSTGAIAELILCGTRPPDIPCENFVPVGLQLNYDEMQLARRAQKLSATPRPCMVLRWENIMNN
jgi:ABC-type uncharacterized transport system substrate-binding protein